MSFKLAGIANVLGNLKDIVDGVDDSISDANEEIARRILSNSQELVPVDTGFLRASGVVEPGSDFSWVIRYGAQYAASVHETHATQSKFLEEPFLEMMTGEQASEIMAQRLFGDLIPG